MYIFAFEFFEISILSTVFVGMWSIVNHNNTRDPLQYCITTVLAYFLSISWSYIFFCVHSFEQKLQVFTRSRRANRKSSKYSPGCWVHLWKCWRSNDSFMWSSIYFLMAAIIAPTSFFSELERSTLWTIERVLCVKQSQGLNFLFIGFFEESREAHVRLPLACPCCEVWATIHLYV